MIKLVLVAISSVVLAGLAASGADASGPAVPHGAQAGVSIGPPVPRSVSIELFPRTGPPSSSLTVSGAGFGAHRAVDIYFDATHEALTSTNAHGAFHSIMVGVPAQAVPGSHWITAVERHPGRSAQARFLVNTNWAQYRYADSHSGFNAYENVLSASTVARMGLQWRYNVEGHPSSPAVVNGVVYVGSDDGNVYALSAGTGAKLWSFRTSGNVQASPAVADGLVYVGSFDRNVYALSAATGAKLWSFRTGSAVLSSPAVADGVVYVASEDGNVYALSAATGAELWSFRTGNVVYSSSPAVANGVVYVGSEDGDVYALSAATGAKLWSFHAGISSGFSSPAVVNGVVYVGGHDLYALSVATGAELWSFHAGGRYAYFSSSPAVAHGVVFIGSDNNFNVYALTAATGAKLWSFATRAPFVESSPAVANGVVYIGSEDDHVYALSAATGTLDWSYATGSLIASSPAIANGVVYIGSEDNYVYAFGLKNASDSGPMSVHARPDPARLRANQRMRPIQRRDQCAATRPSRIRQRYAAQPATSHFRSCTLSIPVWRDTSIRR